MLTAFLSRADVSRHVQALHLLRELREAFTAQARSPSVQTLRFEPPTDGSNTLVRQATLAHVPAWAVTVRSQSSKAVRSVLQLHDGATGQLLAMMDAGHLTALRASLVSALAADVLAKPDARHVAVLGAGAAASSALKALRLVRSIEQVWLYEPNTADNFELAHRLGTTLQMAIRAADSVREAVEHADLIVLTGQVRLDGAALKPGAHVTVLSADQFVTPPLAPDTLANARRFCDAREPALSWGVPFDTELGAVLAGSAPGRTSPDDVTIFTSIGPAHLDLLAAWHVYEGAKHDEALTRIDLEA
jgi:ornithine cyclodeaminase/alanine dehydrogenase-like protein (mu-crystallin family)